MTRNGLQLAADVFTLNDVEVTWLPGGNGFEIMAWWEGTRRTISERTTMAELERIMTELELY